MSPLRPKNKIKNQIFQTGEEKENRNVKKTEKGKRRRYTRGMTYIKIKTACKVTCTRGKFSPKGAFVYE